MRDEAARVARRHVPGPARMTQRDAEAIASYPRYSDFGTGHPLALA